LAKHCYKQAQFKSEYISSVTIKYELYNMNIIHHSRTA